MPAARVFPAVDQKTSLEQKNCCVSSNSLGKTDILSPYERVMYRLNNDDKWQREISLGRRVGFYRFRGDLGTGNFSQVKAAIHCLTKEKVAIKILDKSRLDQKTQKMLSREITSMESLHHPHITRLYEVMETLNKIYLVMEYANGGELFHRISREGRFSEEEAKPLFAQVTSALDHMHQHNIVHRDLKAENVFFAGPAIVKVGDFGFSTQVRSHEDALKTFCGSPPYAAPELFSDDSYVGPLVDVWASGILVFFMLTGTMPFKAPTVAALKKLIIDGQFSVPVYLSEECQWLIRGILQKNPQSRLRLDQIKRSRWLADQILPPGLPRYSMQPPECDGISQLSEEELLSRQQLKELGITDEMMRECWEKGAKSNVTGTYRIVLHKVQVSPRSDTSSRIDSYTALDAASKYHRDCDERSKSVLTPNRKSRTCAIL